ncbi:MAG TPA: DUF2231 domain-containing protein [Candidatus Acidoferrum sp.]|nr:DUF2231 domain-containing protein [Candidatus Acidoferrum sp.]
MERDFTERISARIIKSNSVAMTSAFLDKLLQRCLGAPAMRRFKVFLNGTWIGHPLHPMLTDIPIGAWTLTILIDLIGLLFGFPQLGLASSIAASIGVAGALAAAAAGLADWMDVDPPEKAIGVFHASVNVSATILFLISFLMRWGRHWKLGWTTFVVALVGYLLVMIGGYLGGAMVFYKGVMINRNAYRSGPDNFKPAAEIRELAEGELKRVLVEEQPVLFLKLGGTVYALGAVCSHYGAPLNEGKIVERTIECPWHGSRFALEDGRVVQGPACAGVPLYDCKIVNDQVQIKLRR